MKILKSLYSFFELLGNARAAAAFARMGRPDLAKQLMITDKVEFEVHP